MKKILQDLRGAFLFVAFYSFMINIFMLVAPIYMIQIYDRVIVSRSIETLIYLTIICILALAVYGILFFARSAILMVIGNWIDNKLSPKALEIAFDTHLLGDPYGGQALKDIGLVKQFITGNGILTFFDAPWTPVFLIVIFMLHPMLGIFATCGGVLIFGLALFNEYSTREYLNKSGSTAIFAQRKVDSAMRNADVVQAMGMLPGFIDSWKGYHDKTMNYQTEAGKRSSVVLAIIRFIRLALQLGILGLGAYLVINLELTSGSMIAGSILMARALAPIEQTVGSWKQWVMARQAYYRLEKHLATPETRPCDFQLPEPKGLLEVENLTFIYPKTSKAALSQVSFRLEPGESAAVIGPTASGKSTLSRLIVGALPPYSGTIRLDGAEIYKFKRSIIGEHVGYLPQDIELFSGSVKENIARLGTVDEAAVLEAAQLADVHELILALPQGYETNIGEAGESLSGGQKQRIALARALYGKPKLIVLDEPNSNLDTEGEIALSQALAKAKGWGATIVIVAHRPSVLSNVEKVIIMQNGRVVKVGTRDEILEQLKVKTTNE